MLCVSETHTRHGSNPKDEDTGERQWPASANQPGGDSQFPEDPLICRLG